MATLFFSITGTRFCVLLTLLSAAPLTWAQVTQPVQPAPAPRSALLERVFSLWPPGWKTQAPAQPAAPATSTASPTSPTPPATLKQPTPPSPRASWWTDAGRILAGEEPDAGSTLGKLAKVASVQNHRRLLSAAWSQFEASRLKPAMKFAQAELTAQPASKAAVFYPFSGPDALYVLAMFPEATAFTLMGLEPVGDLPDMAKLSNDELGTSLAQLRRSLNSITALSFFQTNEMRAEFKKNLFPGVTPILVLFISRHGYDVHDVQKVIIEPDGSLRETDAATLDTLAPDRVPGVRIRFARKGETKIRTLHYFRADISDSGLLKVAQPLKWAAGFAPTATYLKSASYLMHRDQFSQVRDFILTKTQMVVQDDSGIPLRFFTQSAWEHTLYGMYDGPIRLFANRMQADMLAGYAASAKPLDFGIGYDHRAKTSNIQRFVRKQK